MALLALSESNMTHKEKNNTVNSLRFQSYESIKMQTYLPNIMESKPMTPEEEGRAWKDYERT